MVFSKRYFIVFLLTSLLWSCKEAVKLDFVEDSIETSEVADIAINIPKAQGTNTVANRINKTLAQHIIAQSNFSEGSISEASIEQALAQFNKEYSTFKTDFPESSQQWEYFVDGEVVYRSEQLICIALTTYLDTGGAHGNTNVKFFNFNAETGAVFSNSDLVEDLPALSEIVQQKLMEELHSEDDTSTINDVFFGKDFQLPESIGFNDEGVIILYNPYEIASYSQGIIEFIVPYDTIDTAISIY